MKSLGLATLLAALFIAGCAPVPPETVAPTSGPLSIGEHAPTLNGVRMWYRVAGRPTGVPVIFIAGGPGGNHYEFATLAGPSLEPSHRMIYLDGRGVGKSERPASADYRIATLIDDIEALRVHLGVPRIAIIADSFGGLLGLNYAAKCPGSLSALVVAGGLWDPVLSCRE
jgi:proline iminopeptidase